MFDGRNRDCITAVGVSGAPTQPIILTSYGEGRAILENCRDQGIFFKRSNWWVIDNLEIRDSAHAIRCQGCQDWVIRRNLLHELDHTCINLQSSPIKTLDSTPTARVNIRHNTCHDTGKTGHGEGFYLNTDPVQDILIEHNELFNLTDEAVNCKGNDRNVVVRHNYIHSAFPPADELSMNGNRLHRMVQRFRQWMLPRAYAGGNPSEDTGIKCSFDTTDNVLVTQNIIENMPYAGIIVKRLSNAVVQHNLIVNANRAIIYDGATIQIAFNTIYDNNHVRLGRGLTNYVSNIAWGNQHGNNPTNPQFVDAAAGDFNLAQGSDRRLTGSDGLSQGVFHSPDINGCAVLSTAPNAVRCTVGAVRFPPLRCPDASAFQVSVNGIPHGPATSCVAVSETAVQINIPGLAVSSTDVVTVSAAYGALQDSAWVGGMTLEGNCLAGLYTCNSMSLAIANQPVVVQTQ